MISFDTKLECALIMLENKLNKPARVWITPNGTVIKTHDEHFYTMGEAIEAQEDTKPDILAAMIKRDNNLNIYNDFDTMENDIQRIREESGDENDYSSYCEIMFMAMLDVGFAHLPGYANSDNDVLGVHTTDVGYDKCLMALRRAISPNPSFKVINFEIDKGNWPDTIKMIQTTITTNHLFGRTKRHGMQQAMLDAGMIGPGQKWWAPHSESKL